MLTDCSKTEWITEKKRDNICILLAPDHATSYVDCVKQQLSEHKRHVTRAQLGEKMLAKYITAGTETWICKLHTPKPADNFQEHHHFRHKKQQRTADKHSHPNPWYSTFPESSPAPTTLPIENKVLCHTRVINHFKSLHPVNRYVTFSKHSSNVLKYTIHVFSTPSVGWQKESRSYMVPFGVPATTLSCM